MKALREAFGDEILQLGREHPEVFVIDCDIGKSCKTTAFSRELPQQYVNVGIAEQNGAGVAAGLATCGLTPFVCTYAAFGSMRMCEQIRQEICYPNLNVKIACSHGGLTPANDGASHQAVEDYGILRALPNMTVVVPCDYYSCRKLIREAAGRSGPVYLRFTRDPVPFIYTEDDAFVIGKARQLRDGGDVTVIATGAVMSLAVAAAEMLEAQGIHCRLLDMHTVKPLDTEAVLRAAAETRGIVTVEDHNILNGVGSAVAEVLAEAGTGRLKRMGIQDQFGESGPYYELLKKNGVTAERIAEAARELYTGEGVRAL